MLSGDRGDRPLVTISMMTYNQERYVREAVRGLLSQDYEPLEVVISDDHSSDSTWEIVQEEVRRYREAGGRHVVILNRNEQNLGLIKHIAVCRLLRHGVLVVGQGGDDISFPNRVSRVVEEWEKSGRMATVIHCGFVEIDIEGRELRRMPPRSAECALGATAAWASRVYNEFPPLDEKKVSIEDQVWAKRALMLGPEVRMPDVLVKYRVGCGISTKFSNAREAKYKNAITMAQSCEQVLADLARVRDQIASERYDLVYEMAKRLFDETDVDWRIVSNLPFVDRFRAVLKKRKQGRIGSGALHFYFQGLTYLQPWGLGSIQRRVFLKLCCIGRKFLAFKGK